ncbi:MAG: hypothetical protein J07AB43_16550 [Candidatus Nanosalina sp. J07AB43]|nr:MAG: hypothetical protein J07AB43_16550 [Candidatus Nanosalina sp. J07AB43]
MDKIPEKFVENRIEELRNSENVRAAAVVGSYARQPDSDHNDLDTFVIVEDDNFWRETEEMQNIVVERFYSPLEEAEGRLEDDTWWKNYHWYTNADVRHDPENLFDRLQEKAKEVKEERLELSEDDRQEIAYSIWDRKQDLDTDDVAQKRYLLNDFFRYLLQKFYLLEGEVPVKLNYRIKGLNGINGYVYKLSQDFLLSSSTSEKEQIIEKIIDYMSKDLPEISPEWDSEKQQS